MLAVKVRKACKNCKFPLNDDNWPLDAPKFYEDLTFELKSCRQPPQPMQATLSNKRSRNVFTWNSQEINQSCFSSGNMTKNIADLFTMKDKSRPRIILVEGAPGIGKTRLTKEIALRWANKDMLLDVKIVFVLHLRDPEIQKINTMESFIHYCSERWYIGNEQVTCAIEQIENSEGCTGLFLIDGFDEYPSRLRQKSFIISLINGEVFPEFLLLITSRPNASFTIKHSVDRIVEIVGFAEDEQKQYIMHSLKAHPEKENQLNEHLKELLVIKSYCRIPLNLAVLIHLVLNDTGLPETLTQLNEKFILHTIYRHMNKQNVQQLSPLGQLSDIEDSQHRSFIYQLAKLAYNGVQENKLVFTLEEMKQACPQMDNVPDGISGFGLLQSVKHFAKGGVGIATSFNFTHYTFQEYLAAFYVSSLSDEEQYVLMIANVPNEQFLSYDVMSGRSCHNMYSEMSFWNSQFSFMWSMYMGITKGRSMAFQRFMQGFKPGSNVLHTLLLFQYFIESNNNLSLSNIFMDKTINLGKDDPDFTYFAKVVQPHHMHSLVAFLYKNWMSYERWQFINLTIPVDSLNILQNFFLFNPEKVKQLKYLHFENNGMFLSGSNMISTFITMGQLEELVLINNNVDAEEIASGLANNYTIKSLVLSSTKLTHLNINPIIISLSITKMLVDLDLSNNCCGSKGAEILANFLHGNPNLNSLDLCDNMIGLSEDGIKRIEMYCADMMGGFYDSNISVTTTPDLVIGDYDHTGIFALTAALRNNSTLQQLELSGNFIERSGVEALACTLQYNTTIKLLDLSRNQIDIAGAEMIANAIHANSHKSLTSLDISSSNIGDSGMCKLCAMLHYANLQSLDVADNELKINGLKEVAQLLKKNDITLSCLHLESNSIDDAGAKHLASALRVNKSLRSLHLRDNLIGDEGAEAISSALKKNTILEELDLSMNDISNEGAFAICEALCVNSALNVLFIPFNPITETAIAKILSIYTDTKRVESSIQYAYLYSLKGTNHEGVYRTQSKSRVPLYHFTVYLTKDCVLDVLSSMWLLDHTMWKQADEVDIDLPDIESFCDEMYADLSDDSDQD